LAPSPSELNNAVTELFHEDAPDMTEADYAEHGVAHLRYGFDDGPMYVLEVSRTGKATLEEWADQDFEQELRPARTISVTAQQAVDLWRLLTDGKIDAVRAAFGAAA
jgi:hypothetical protein